MSVSASTVFSVAMWSSRVLYSLRLSGLIVCAVQWWWCVFPSVLVFTVATRFMSLLGCCRFMLLGYG